MQDGDAAALEPAGQLPGKRVPGPSLGKAVFQHDQAPDSPSPLEHEPRAATGVCGAGDGRVGIEPTARRLTLEERHRIRQVVERLPVEPGLRRTAYDARIEVLIELGVKGWGRVGGRPPSAAQPERIAEACKQAEATQEAGDFPGRRPRRVQLLDALDEGDVSVAPLRGGLRGDGGCGLRRCRLGFLFARLLLRRHGDLAGR